MTRLRCWLDVLTLPPAALALRLLEQLRSSRR